MTPDVNIFLIDFPVTEKEAVTHNEDDSYTIFINARHSYENQLKAYEHAMWHILHNDFAGNDVQEIEATAHGTHEPVEIITTVDNLQAEKKIRRLRRKRNQLRKKIQEYDEMIKAMQDAGVDFFARAEHRYLYGNDY